MNTGKALLAGAVGGIVMTLLGLTARAIGIQVNAEMMLGTMFGGPPSTGKWIVGLLVHLVLSGLIALLYAVGFEYVTRRASWGIGVAFSLVHIIIAGVVMGLIPAMHPMIPEEMPAPGAFMANMGGTFVAFFLIEHLVYGGVVGALYEPQHRRVLTARA